MHDRSCPPPPPPPRHYRLRSGQFLQTSAKTRSSHCSWAIKFSSLRKVPNYLFANLQYSQVSLGLRLWNTHLVLWTSLWVWRRRCHSEHWHRLLHPLIFLLVCRWFLPWVESLQLAGDCANPRFLKPFCSYGLSVDKKWIKILTMLQNGLSRVCCSVAQIKLIVKYSLTCTLTLSARLQR